MFFKLYFYLKQTIISEGIWVASKWKIDNLNQLILIGGK